MDNVHIWQNKCLQKVDTIGLQNETNMEHVNGSQFT